MENKKFGKIFFVLGFVLLVAGVIASISFSYAESDNPGSSSITIGDDSTQYKLVKTAKWVGDGIAEISFKLDTKVRTSTEYDTDFIVVLDRTNSMDKPLPSDSNVTRMDEAKEAINALIDKVLIGNNRVAFITFVSVRNTPCGTDYTYSEGGYLEAGKPVFASTENKEQLKKLIEDTLAFSNDEWTGKKGCSPTHATRYYDPLMSVNNLLNNFKSDNKRIVLFVTDGDDNYGNSYEDTRKDIDAVKEGLSKLKNYEKQDIEVYGILYNDSEKNDCGYISCLKYLVNNDPKKIVELKSDNYNKGDLYKAFTSLVVRNYDYITVEDTIGTDFELVNNQSFSNNVTLSDNGSKLTWNVGSLKSGESAEFKFNVKVKSDKEVDGSLIGTNNGTSVKAMIVEEEINLSSSDTPELNNGYKVTYDMNYPEATTENKIEEYHRAYSSVYLKDKLSNYNDYVFKEWICSDPNVSILNEGFKMPTNDVTFTAVWEKIEITKEQGTSTDDKSINDINNFGYDSSNGTYASKEFSYFLTVRAFVWNENREFGISSIKNISIVDEIPYGLSVISESDGVVYDSDSRSFSINISELSTNTDSVYVIKVKTPDSLDDSSTTDIENSMMFTNVSKFSFDGSGIFESNSVRLCAGVCEVNKYSVTYQPYEFVNCPNYIVEALSSTQKIEYYFKGQTVNISSPSLSDYYNKVFSALMIIGNWPGSPSKKTFNIKSDVSVSTRFNCKDIYTVNYSIDGDKPKNFVVPSSNSIFEDEDTRLTLWKGQKFDDYVFDGWKGINIGGVYYEFGEDFSIDDFLNISVVNGLYYFNVSSNSYINLMTSDRKFELVGSFTRNKYNVKYILAGDLPSVDNVNSGGYSFTKDDNNQYVYNNEYYYNDDVIIPSFGEIEGYVFKGWKYNDSLINSFKMPMENVTLTGEFTRRTYSINIRYCLYGSDPCVEIDDSDYMSGLYGDSYKITSKTIPGYTLVADSNPSDELLSGTYGPSMSGTTINFYYKLASDGVVSVSKIIKDGDIYKYHGTPVFIFKLISTDILGNDHTYYRTVVFDEGYEHYQYSPLGYEEFIKTVSFDDLPYGTYTLSMIGVNRYKTGSLYDNINGLNPSLTKQFDINSDRTSYTYYSLATKKDATRLSHNAYYTTTAV